MAQDADFDLDKLLKDFRPEDKEDLDRPIAGFVPSEEHVAAAAQANGTAAGDGVAVGAELTPYDTLARAVDNLAVAVRGLADLAKELRLIREDEPEQSVTETLLGSDPQPPKPRRRAK